VTEFGVRALAETMVEARRWSHAAPELRDYHATKRSALAKALGADEIRQRRSPLDLLLDSTVKRLARSSSPFDDFLEAPESINATYRRHGPAINEAAAGLRAALMALLTDLVCEAYAIPPDRTVHDKDLCQWGFDARVPEPDPLDFW
jgi:hypothetical protein